MATKGTYNQTGRGGSRRFTYSQKLLGDRLFYTVYGKGKTKQHAYRAARRAAGSAGG